MMNILITLFVGIAIGALIGSLITSEAAYSKGYVNGDQDGYIRRNREMGKALNYMERQDLFIKAVKEYDPKRKRVLSATAAQDK